MSNVKGALRSKAVWGAIMTLVGALGLLPFGITFDAQTGDVTFNVYTVIGGLASIAIPGGGLFAGFGRLVAKGPIRGLW